MGTLKSNEQYIYKRENGITYSKPKNIPSANWEEVGREYPSNLINETMSWHQIIYDAHFDPDLKRELERVKLYYYLKYNGSKT